MPRSLHVITTGRQSLEELLGLVSGWKPGDVDALHLREKGRGARELWSWHEALSRAIPHTPVYINDRLDAAWAAKAPGVQLGYASLPPAAARRLLGPGTRIGVSVHSPEEAALAEGEGADYVIFGHIFPTASKQDLPPRGTDALQRVVQACRLPVLAIGGITPDNAAEVVATGCAGIAVLSGILEHPDPVGQLKRYREAMNP